MSEWQGFDQRKVCPQCGDYQTHLGIYERIRDLQVHRSLWMLLIVSVIITLLLIILTIAIVVTRKVSPKPYHFVGLFLTIGLGVSQLLNYYLNSRNPKKNEPAKPSQRLTVYHLTCWNCGYEWKKTIDEWEQEGKAEL